MALPPKLIVTPECELPMHRNSKEFFLAVCLLVVDWDSETCGWWGELENGWRKVSIELVVDHYRRNRKLPKVNPKKH